jgi:hypothetical protein
VVALVEITDERVPYGFASDRVPFAVERLAQSHRN